MKTLLAVIRDPGFSKEFVQYCVFLAKDLKAKVNFLFIQPPDAFPMGAEGAASAITAQQVTQTLEINAREAKKQIMQSVNEIHPEITSQVPVMVITKIGSIQHYLQENLEKDSDQMVLLENPNEENFWLAGTPYMDIIREVNCPIWVIPKETRYAPLNEIVYATDYRVDDPATIKKIIGMSDKFTPNITALHVSESLDFDEKLKSTGLLDTLKNKLGYKKLDVKAIVENNHAEIPNRINNFAEKMSADLIVVLKENRKFIDRIFSSSATKHIIKHAHLPVLVYHEQH